MSYLYETSLLILPRCPHKLTLLSLQNFKDGDEVVPIPVSPRKASEGASTGKGKEPVGDDNEGKEVTTKKDVEEKVGEESSSPSNPQGEAAPTSTSNDDDGEERRLDDSTAESSTSRSPATTSTSTTSNSEVNSTKDATGATSSLSEDDDKTKKSAEAAPATADEDKKESKSEEAAKKPKKPSTTVPPELDRHITVIINAIAGHKSDLDAYLLDEANFPGRVDANKESTEQLNEFLKNLKKDVPVNNKPAAKSGVEESTSGKGRKGGSKKGWRCNIL